MLRILEHRVGEHTYILVDDGSEDSWCEFARVMWCNKVRCEQLLEGIKYA